MKNNIKKRISNTKDLSKALNIEITDKDEKLLDEFLKKKIIHIEDTKIIYPKINEIKKKKTEVQKNINNIEKTIDHWKKNKNKVERHMALFPITMYLKKNFWRHKIKELTNKEYKQDIIDTKLTDQILLDPEHNNLFETFLVNPDYRKKLKETVKTSIVYKYNTIGGHSDKKREFRIKTYQIKIEQLEKQLIDFQKQKEIYSKVIEILKKNN